MLKNSLNLLPESFARFRFVNLIQGQISRHAKKPESCLVSRQAVGPKSIKSHKSILRDVLSDVVSAQQTLEKTTEVWIDLIKDRRELIVVARHNVSDDKTGEQAESCRREITTQPLFAMR